MLIENQFTVDATADRAWAYLLDVEKVVPCMPGAELTEVVDDHTWKGVLRAKFGPVSMSFAGTVTMESRDDDAHRVILRAKGMEQKGKGAADASVTSWLEPSADAARSTVKMEADITLSGAAAQMSRGLLPEISRKLTQQFADCLQANMQAERPTEAAPHLDEPPTDRPPAISPAAEEAAAVSTVAPKPVGGLGLGLSAIWATVVQFFRRLFGRSTG